MSQAMAKVKVSKYGQIVSATNGIPSIFADIEKARNLSPTNKLIDLSTGSPKEFPELTALWKKHAVELIESENFGDMVSRYIQINGSSKLIDAVVSLMKKQNLDITPQNVLIGAGCQMLVFYALNLFSGAFDGATKKILFPLCPEYAGYAAMGIPEQLIVPNKANITFTAKHSFKYSINFDSLNLTDVGAVVLSRPCNPSGNIISDEELKQLIQVTKKAGVPLIIDGVYSSPIPNLVYKNNINIILDSNVIYITSLSKAGFAGERVGIAIGSEELLRPLKFFQANTSLMSSKLGQLIASRVLAGNDLENLCKNVINKFYKKKLNLIKELFETYFPDNINYYLHDTEGGMFQWLWLKDLPITDRQLYEQLKQDNLFIMPGSMFFINVRYDNWKHSKECIRISLNSPDEDLEQGIQILAHKVKNIYK